jgi:hypothetical protein
MVKTVLGAIVVLTAFAGALYAGGNVMGAWKPYEPPQASGKPGAQPRAASPRRTRSKPTRDARWIRHANALCRDARRNDAQTRQPRTAAELRAFLTSGAKTNRRWNARLLRLGVPRGETKRYARLRALFREDEAMFSDLARAVRRRDGGSAMLLGERLMSLARRESSLLVSLGARDCALPSGS